jgi:hypothetical protein
MAKHPAVEMIRRGDIGRRKWIGRRPLSTSHYQTPDYAKRP